MNDEESLRRTVETLRQCIADVAALGERLPDRTLRRILGLLWLASDEIRYALGEPLSAESTI